MGDELQYFYIENALGGSQDWMKDPWMRLGGCAALAAVDSLIYFALTCKKTKFCPVDVHKLTKSKYIQFASIMKPYLRPRFNGVSKLSLYLNGFGKYLSDQHISEIRMREYPFGQPLEQAEAVLTEQIRQGYPVPVLLLNPLDKTWAEFKWHWFMLGGIKKEEDRTMVKAITYGEGVWLPFDRLWDTKNPANGGFILYDVDL